MHLEARANARVVIVKDPSAETKAMWLNMGGALLQENTTGAVWGHSATAGAISIAPNVAARMLCSRIER